VSAKFSLLETRPEGSRRFSLRALLDYHRIVPLPLRTRARGLGFVDDSTGAVVPGVTLTVTNDATHHLASLEAHTRLRNTRKNNPGGALYPVTYRARPAGLVRKRILASLGAFQRQAPGDAHGTGLGWHKTLGRHSRNVTRRCPLFGNHSRMLARTGSVARIGSAGRNAHSRTAQHRRHQTNLGRCRRRIRRNRNGAVEPMRLLAALRRRFARKPPESEWCPFCENEGRPDGFCPACGPSGSSSQPAMPKDPKRSFFDYPLIRAFRESCRSEGSRYRSE
jgi:hypothetical protein